MVIYFMLESEKSTIICIIDEAYFQSMIRQLTKNSGKYEPVKRC